MGGVIYEVVYSLTWVRLHSHMLLFQDVFNV